MDEKRCREVAQIVPFALCGVETTHACWQYPNGAVRYTCTRHRYGYWVSLTAIGRGGDEVIRLARTRP